MSLGKKRAVSLDVEPVHVSDTLKKSEREKPSASGRLQRPVKRRRTEEPSCMPKPLELKEGYKVKKKVWTATATEAFFEGLYQHGKDFHQILKYMQSKYKKKKDPTIPKLTKNQVRFFFYRTWHKVSALLAEPSHQQQSTESKKSKALKLTAAEASPQPVEERKAPCLSEEEVENQMDTSLEEPEVAEGSPGMTDTCTSVFQEGETTAEPIPESMLEQGSPTLPVESEQTKEGVEPSPGGAPPSTTEKYESKKDPAKDTVLVNGVKHSLDLVALVCYHKLKSKCPGDHNFGKRLCELVYHGNTTVMNRAAKGKRRVQIKIPNCRALQVVPKPPVPAGEGQGVADHGTESGLYEAEPYTPTSGPKQITVELRPFSSASWLYVQGLSQNPRLRLTVTASKTVSQLLQFLALKWQLEPNSGNCVSLYHSYKPTGASPSVSLPKESPPNPVPYREHSTEPEDISEKPLPSPSDKTSATCSPSVQESWVQDVNACSSKECDNAVEYPDSVKQKLPPPNCVETTDASVACFPSPQAVCEPEAVQSEVCSPVENSSTPWSHPEKPSVEFCKGPSTKEDLTRDHPAEDSSCESSDQCEAAWRLCTAPVTSMGELHYKFCQPDRLQLLYELHLSEKKGTTTSLQMALKLVDFVGNTELMTKQQQSSPSVGSHKSPKVAEYIRSLPKKSPHKSPLSKYYRLKHRSPFKSAMLRHPARRIRLNFDAEPDSGVSSGNSLVTYMYESCEDDKVLDQCSVRESVQENAKSGGVSVTNGLSIAAPSLKGTQPNTAFSSPSPLISTSSSPTVMNVLQMHQNSPEIIQLSKQNQPSRDSKMQLVNLSTSTLESHGPFSGMRLQSLFSTAGKAVLQKGKGKESNSLETILLRPAKKSRDSHTSSPNQIQAVNTSVSGKVCSETGMHSPNQSVVSATTTSLAACTTPAISSASLKIGPATPRAGDVHRLPTAAVPALVDKKLGKQTVGKMEKHQIESRSGEEIPNASKLSSLPQHATRSLVTVTNLSTATGKFEVPPRLTFGIQTSKSIAQPTVVSSTPVPIVTALKPFSKPRKVKKIQSKAGQARQLVPRPLLFLPNVPGLTAAQQSPAPMSTFASPTVTRTATTPEAPATVSAMADASSTSATPPSTATSTLQHQVLALVQTLLLQQQNQRLQAARTSQKIPTAVDSTTKAMSVNAQSADVNPAPSEVFKKDFSDKEVQGAILDNFLAEHAADLDTASTSNLFHTSSDTVNELLRGLSSKQDDRSIQRLSEETADVLPTFAKALGGSVHPADGVGASLTAKADNTMGIDPERSENSDLPFLNENSVSFSDILGSASDSHFRQLAEKGDLLDHIDFPDVLLHPKDAVTTPEKPKQHDSDKLPTRRMISAPNQESEVSLGGLLDFLCSPEKLQSQPPSEAAVSSVDSTYKSLLEDSSVDYIHKFRELASKMNSQP